MNIFFTSNCPVECAQNLDDKRVVKMCLETAQMLSTALRENGVTDARLYKSTHRNHPSCKWVRETDLNYAWTLTHLEALLEEYTKRYGKVHASSKLLELFYEYMDKIPEGDLTDFANCAARQDLGINYKNFRDATTAYMLYLNDRWSADKKAPTWYGIGRK